MRESNDFKSLRYPRKFLPKQKEVLDAVKNHTFVLYSGAFGAGKTLLICNIVIRECINNPGSLWFMGSQTVPQLRDTVVRTFLQECELYDEEISKAVSGFKLVKSWKPSILSLTFFNGSEVLFRSCDNPTKFKSLNLDGFALDEPVDIDEQVFLMLQGHLRGKNTKHHIGVLAGNPSGKTNWVYRRFFVDKNKEFFVVHTTTYDNLFLPDGYIRNCEDSFDAEYAKRYLHGEWGDFEGLIYKDFNVSTHVCDVRDKKFEYFLGGYDDGFRNPACLLTIGVTSDSHLSVVNEFYEHGKTSDDIVSEICEINRVYPMRKIFVDPSAQNIIGLMKDKHLSVFEANNDVDNGIAHLKMFFKNNVISVDYGCKNLIKELQSYRYERDFMNKNQSERPLKKDDHACDALRYGTFEFNPFKKPTFCGIGSWKHG